MKINRNQVLLAIGLLAYAGPDLDAVARWLSGSGIPHITGVVHLLGWLATALGGLALAWPRIRSGLAALGLATPPGAQAPWIAGKDDVVPFAGAVPEKKQDQTPVTVPITPRKPDKGGALTGLLGYLALVLGICLTVVCVYIVMMFAVPKRAQAQTPTPGPQFGGCFASGTICLGPSAAITVGQFNLSTSKFTGGFIPGAGYGATFMADTWHTVGADLYLSFVVSQGAPNNAIPTLMLSFANYLRVGLGYSITEQSAGAALKQPLLMFGVGSNFGGSTSYQQKQATKAVEADRAGKAAAGKGQ